MPKITVLMPVYNGARFLKNAVESILGQTFGDYEFLIIDDRSCDNSEEIIRSYDDKRIRYVKNEKNVGQMDTLNIGIKLSRGKYVARMDQDDISLPDRFKKEVYILDGHENIALVYSDSFIIDDKGVRTQKTFFDYSRPHRFFVFDRLIRSNFIVGNTVMMRRSVFKDMGPYNNSHSIAAEYGLYLKLALNHKVDFIDEPLAEYRVHGNNASTNSTKCFKEVIEILSGLDNNITGKCYKKLINKTIAEHMAGLAMLHLFQHEREMCREKAGDSLKKNHFNMKALTAIFMASLFPDVLLERARLFRKGWFK